MIIQDLTANIAQRTGINPATAEQAIGTILSIIQLEGQGDKVGELFAKLPGATELALQYSVANAAPQAGLMGTLTGLATSVLGNNAGILLKGVSQLQSLGLSMEQIKTVGQDVLDYASKNGGSALTKQITSNIPGLHAQLAA